MTTGKTIQREVALLVYIQPITFVSNDLEQKCFFLWSVGIQVN